MATSPAAALGIIIGTKCGETSRGPPSRKWRTSRPSAASPTTPRPTTPPARAALEEVAALALERVEPTDARPDDHADAAVAALADRRLGPRLVGRGDREL